MNILFYILAFVYVYNIPFTNMPVSGSKIVVFILLIFTLLNRKIVFKKIFFHPIIWILMLLIYSAFNILLQNTSDYSLAYSCILFIVNHFIGCFLFANILKVYNRLSIDYVLKLLIIIATIQSIIICLMMFSSFIFSIVSQVSLLDTRASIYQRYNGARGYGMAASITYDLSVVQSFSLLFIMYLIPGLNKAARKYYILSYALIIISILVTGRTGLVGILLSFVLLISKNRKAQKKALNRIVSAILFCCFVFIVTIIILQTTKIFNSIKNYVLESLYNFFETGSFSTSTGGHIWMMFIKFSQVSLKTFVFGDARYQGEGKFYYGNVDVGYFRHIYYFGIIGTSILLLAYKSIYTKIKSKILDKKLMLLWNILFVYFTIAHIKGDFLLGCSMGICVLLILYFTIILDNTNDNRIKRINNIT